MESKSHPHWTLVGEHSSTRQKSFLADWVDTDNLNGSNDGIHATK